MEKLKFDVKKKTKKHVSVNEQIKNLIYSRR